MPRPTPRLTPLPLPLALTLPLPTALPTVPYPPQVSLAKRAGLPDTAALAALPDDHPAWDVAAHYLGAMCANLVRSGLDLAHPHPLTPSPLPYLSTSTHRPPPSTDTKNPATAHRHIYR